MNYSQGKFYVNARGFSYWSLHEIKEEPQEAEYTFSWKKVSVSDSKSIPTSRSSHGVSAIKNTTYVFGGENVPRTAIDSTLHTLSNSEGKSGAINGKWN